MTIQNSRPDFPRRAIGVYGASGHTGRFIVAELRKHGIPLIAMGRGPDRSTADLPYRVAELNAPDDLVRALAGCAVVINCAGPFLDSAPPLIDAALRARCSYVDVTAEQASAQSSLDDYDEAARSAGIAILPAAGFYGGLADLLASAIVRDDLVDSIATAVHLDRWWPTTGTRQTGERNRATRLIVDEGQLAPITTPSAHRAWEFTQPLGEQSMVELPFSEVITLAHHLRPRSIRSFINTGALDDVRNPTTPSPTPVDDDGRSAQRFVMDVAVTIPTADGRSVTRRASARGQDIYATSAPMAVRAALCLLDPAFTRRGTMTLGGAFDAREFLGTLHPRHLTVAYEPTPTRVAFPEILQ